jgi:MYXO-CTERM domain-containing protein
MLHPVVRLGTWFVGGLAFAASCGEERLTPTSGDRAPEVSISGAQLRAEFAEQNGWLVSPPLDAPDRATTVGLMYDLKRDRVDARVRFEARGFDRFGRAGSWVAAEVTFREAELFVARAELGIAAAEAQIRVSSAEADHLSFVLWSAVVPMESDDAPIATLDRGGIRADRRALSGSLSAGGVRSRADWGARATLCSDQDPVKTRMAVHHTVSPASSSNGYEARLRQIQAFHMDTRGWCDVGYHFFVTTDGSRWEAREAIYLGAHVANNNSNNVGTVFVGCFHPGDATCDSPDFQPNVPPEAMILGGGTMLGLLKNEYGIPVDDQTVLGHRDHAGAQTSCPGNSLYAELPRLRDLANGVNPGPETGTINGVVWDLSVTAGPADPGNVRVTTAKVTVSSGQQADVREGDAFWSFNLEPGLYTFTAEAPGFAPASRDLMITANQEVWGSIGLVPMQQAIDLTVHVTSETGEPIAGAEVSLGAIGAALSGEDGRVVFTTPTGGSALLTVRKEGFRTHQSEVTFAASAAFEVRLVEISVAEPGKPDFDPPVEAVDPQQMTPADPPPAEEEAEGGCGCAAHGEGSGSMIGLLLLAMGWSVRRPRR